jgi:hypothetical protein
MQKNLVSKLFLAVVIIGGLIAGAGFLSEKGVRLVRSSGQTPGAQAVRTPQGQASSPSAQVQSDGSHPRGAAKKERRAQKTQKGRRLAIGQTPIPLFVNGKEKAPLVGSALQQNLPTVRIVTLHDARTGWAVADILGAQDITQAKQVIFTNKDGKRWSANWAQILDSKTRLIVTYSKHDTLLLFSGPKEETEKRQSPQQIKEVLGGRTDLVSFPGVVKIEVIGAPRG